VELARGVYDAVPFLSRSATMGYASAPGKDEPIGDRYTLADLIDQLGRSGI